MSKKNSRIEINVLKAKQPIGDFFVASMKPDELVDISFADIRRIEERDIEKYLGIQRPLNKTRVKQIKEYIQGKEATFPTSIILAVDEKCAEYNEENQILTLYPYEADEESNEESIEFRKIAKVLDGQHRIAGFLDDNDNYSLNIGRTFELNVSIFVGIDVSEQANIFATVNLAQTKVNKSLVYDLEELSKIRSPHKTCHLIAVALDADPESPLHQRIKRLGVATPGREFEPLTQATVVESLVKFLSPDPFQDRRQLLEGHRLQKVDIDHLRKFPFRNLFIDGNDEAIYKILFNFFKAVENKWPTAWNELQRKGNLLPKSNAFNALMKFLKNNVYLELAGNNIGTIPSQNEFANFFHNIGLADEDFNTRNFSPGSGGQSAFYKLLTGQLSKEDFFKDQS
ncbi:DGQHR domain-containing protein [Nitrosomonas sp. Nm34]|nr:DGQHR domain-containing protein [Nitrosomonas sp. Nm34]